MKAIVYARYGPPEVLHRQEEAKPAPHDVAAHRYVEQGHKKGNVVTMVGNTHPQKEA